MSTGQIGGLFISFEHARREVFEEAVEAFGRFSVELSISDWQPEERNFFLVSLAGDPEFVDYAALGRRKRGPRNTGAHNIEFSEFVSFKPVKLSGLLKHVPSSARATIKEREGDRGLWFPPVAWAAVFEQLQKSRPSSAANLDRLRETVNSADHYASSSDIRRLSMQRDAIGLSMDIAGLDTVRRLAFRKPVSVAAAGEVESFIDLMDARSLKNGCWLTMTEA